MGKHFGELAFIRGIVYYKLSPHELKPFAGAITYGIPNFARFGASWFYCLPQFLIGYLVYKGLKETHYQSTRKDVRSFLNEVPPPPE